MEKNSSTCTNSSQAVSFTIFGEPASKANSRRLVNRGGKPMFIKSEKALDYAGAFKLQAPNATPLEGDVVVHIKIYYASRRPDLDESLILDLLQGIAYTNDRQVREKHIYWGLDKELPRAEILVEKKGEHLSELPARDTLLGG